MRKILAIIVLVALGFVLYQYTGEQMEGKKKNSQLEEVISYDLDRYYPSTPKEVVDFFSQTLEFIYTKEVDEETVALLLQQQRKLFDEELLENNPYEVHLERLLVEKERYEATDKKIIDYKIKELTPDDYGLNNQVSNVRIIYYLVEEDNPNINVYQKFVLQKDANNLWKIKGWVETEEFTIVGD